MNKIITYLMTSILLFGLVQPTVEQGMMVVRAEEGGETEEVQTTRRDNFVSNVYERGNDNIISGVNEASTYDPSLHYALTYNVLNSKLSELGLQSPYAKVYTGNEGGAYTGVIGGAVEEKLGKNKTSAEEYILQLDPTTAQDATNEDGIQAPIESGDTEDVNAEDKANASTEQKELRDAAAKDLAKRVSNAINGTLTVGGSSKDYTISKGSFMEKSGSGTKSDGGNNVIRIVTEDLEIKELNDTAKKALDKATQTAVMDKMSAIVDGEGKESNLVNGILQETEKYVLTNLGKEKITQSARKGYYGYTTLDNNILPSWDFTDWKVEQRYLNIGEGNKITVGNKGTVGIKDDERHWLEEALIVSSNDLASVEDINAKKIQFRPILILELPDKYSDGDKSLYTNTINSLVYSNSTQLDKKTTNKGKDAVETAIKEFFAESENYKNWKNHVDENKVSTEGYSLVTWTPLSPVFKSGEDYNITEIVENMTKYDETGADGIAYVKDGKERLLETGDMFIDSEKISNILLGKVSIDGSGDVSTLHVGSNTTNLKTKDGVKVNKYVGTEFKDGKVDKEATYDTSAEGVTESAKMLNSITRYQDSWGSTFTTKLRGKNAVLGVDNYGNILVGSEGLVILPYWQNDLFTPLEKQHKDGMYKVGSALNTDTDGEEFITALDAILSDTIKENNDIDVSEFIGQNKEAKNMVDSIRENLSSNADATTLKRAITKGGISGYSAEDVKQALAVIIAADTKEHVEEFNGLMLDSSQQASRLFMLPGNSLQEESGLSEDDVYRWTAAGLIQKIGYIMDYGFMDTIRLTVVRTLVSFYNSSVRNADLTGIFYTDNILNNDAGAYSNVLMGSIIALVLTVYIFYMLFKLWRETTTFKVIMRQFIMLASVLVIPAYIYGPLTNYVLNKPTEVMLGNQMKTSVMLDTYLEKDNLLKETNEYYENMFGKKDEDATIGSYMLRFYTTEDRAGFDINDYNPDKEDNTLTFAERNRLKRYHNGEGYPKDRLVSVDVEILDLYKWVWDTARNLATDGDEEIAFEDIDFNAEELIYERDNDAVTPLFEWLAQGGGTYHKVTGYEPELATYEEYNADLLRPLIKRYKGYEVAVKERYGQENVLNLTEDGVIKIGDVQRILGTGDTIMTASELFYEVIRNSSIGNVVHNVGELQDLSRLISLSGVNVEAGTHYIPTQEEIQTLVRDLSLTHKRRNEYFGDDLYAPFSSMFITNAPNPMAIGDYVQMVRNDTDGSEVLPVKPMFNLKTDGNLYTETDDFLNIRGVIERVLPVREQLDSQYSTGVFNNVTIDGDIFDINQNLLMTYLSVYSYTRASLGNTRVEENLHHAEQMVMGTEAFFQLNNVLGLDLYPQHYYIGGITLDKYLTLVYVPFKDYGEATLNFMDSSPVVPKSTAEAIALSSNMLELALFIVAMILLILFGLIYTAIFSFVLLVIIVYSYIKNYVVKADFSNKSWLGTLMIYGTFGGTKFGLVSMWYVITNMMNTSVAENPAGLVQYPYVLIHSIAIAGYMAISMFIIVKVLSMVVKDFDNLGGQAFSEKLREMGNKGIFKGRMSGGNTSGSSVRDAKNREGSRGKNRNQGAFTQNSGISHLGASAATLAGAGGAYMSDGMRKSAQERAAKAVDDKVKGKGTAGLSGKNSYKGQIGAEDDKIKLHKGMSKNLADHMLLSRQINKVNKIDSTVGGVSDKVMKGAKIGEVLASVGETALTTVDLGTKASAAKVAASLTAAGIASSVVGKMVHFDSTGYNLEDKEVRSELFRGGIKDLQDTYQEERMILKDGRASNVLPYTTNDDGTVTLNFGEEYGLDGRKYTELIESKEFNKMFERPVLTDRELGADGVVSGDVKVRLKDPDTDLQGINKGVSNVFKKDDKIRKEFGLEERAESRYNRKISIDQIADEDLETVKLRARQNNIPMQGNEIYYDGGRKHHTDAIDTIKGLASKKDDELQLKYGNPSKNLMSYVVKDGKDVGVHNTTSSASKAPVAAAAVYGMTEMRKGLTKVKVDPTKEKEIVERRDTLHKLTGFSKERNAEVEKLKNVKDTVAQKARNSLAKETSTGEKDFSIYNNETEKFLGSTTFKDDKGFVGIQDKRKKVEKLFNDNRISSEEYVQQQNLLSNSYEQFMKDRGIADDFNLGITKTKDPQLTKNYYTVLDSVAQGAGIHRVELSKMRSKDLDTKSKLVTDKDALKIKNGVASIAYKEEDVRNKVGVSGPKGDLEQFILQTNKGKNYVDKETDRMLDYYLRGIKDTEPRTRSGKKVTREDYIDPDLYDEAMGKKKKKK